MAFNISSLPEYVKQDYAPLVHDLLFERGTVERMRWQTDVKGSAAINILSTDPVLQDGSACGFDAEGDATFTQRVIDTKIVKVNMEFCDKNLIPAWTQYEVRISADEHPMPFEEYIVRDVIQKVQLMRENLIWKGDEDSVNPDLTLMNGLLKILGDEASTIDVAITAGTSVYDAIKQMIIALPAELSSRDVKINISPEMYKLFILGLVEKNYYHYSGPQDSLPTEFVFPGTRVRVVETLGLSGTLNMVASMDENFVYGTDLSSDASKIVNAGYDEKTGSHWLRIEWNMGVQVAFPQLAVLGTFAASPTE